MDVKGVESISAVIRDRGAASVEVGTLTSDSKWGRGVGGAENTFSQ